MSPGSARKSQAKAADEIGTHFGTAIASSNLNLNMFESSASCPASRTESNLHRSVHLTERLWGCLRSPDVFQHIVVQTASDCLDLGGVSAPHDQCFIEAAPNRVAVIAKVITILTSSKGRASTNLLSKSLCTGNKDAGIACCSCTCHKCQQGQAQKDLQGFYHSILSLWLALKRGCPCCMHTADPILANVGYRRA